MVIENKKERKIFKNNKNTKRERLREFLKQKNPTTQVIPRSLAFGRRQQQLQQLE